MTTPQHVPYTRHWRLRTILFGLFTGLSVFLLENLIDPFLPKDANNNQLWSNTIVALVAGLIALIVLAYIVAGAIRRGFWERNLDARYKMKVPAALHYVMVLILAVACFVPLIFLTA